VLDIDFGPGESGLEILVQLRERCSAEVLILTGTRDQEICDQAVLRGARGVVHKEEPAEVILSAIAKIHAGETWLDQRTVSNVLKRVSSHRNEKLSEDEVKIANLTRKEREVIATLVQTGGSTNKWIAGHLKISEHTLRNHLSSIYGKLHVANRLELYVYVSRHDALLSGSTKVESAS
jgi:two-component system, NarL family, nitrate/nitrite response regulator NarL